ncbi:MAG: hypothetical protein GYB65_12245, partial [Chloroflexi bacterium]|nr:hypothetical protein [Chloroflexota bacterium]
GVFCLQTGPQSALYQFKGNDETGQPAEVVLFTPDGELTFDVTPAAREMLGLPWTYVTHHRSLAVLAAEMGPSEDNGIPFGGAVLVNLDARTVDALAGTNDLYYGWESNVRFSEDGRYLRYASETEDEWTLWERDLQTGQERAVYADYPGTGDRYGENWLSFRRVEVGDDYVTRYVQVTLDGNETILASITDDDAVKTTIRMEPDGLISYDRNCLSDPGNEMGCTLEYTPFDGSDPLVYMLPGDVAARDSSPRLFPLLYDTHLLIELHIREDESSRRYTEYWLLESDGAALFLGYNGRVLADGRIVMASERIAEEDDETWPYRIWDTDAMAYTAAVVGTPDYGAPGLEVVEFYNGIVFIEDLSDWRSSVYRFADQSAFSLPLGWYPVFHLLPDGTTFVLDRNGLYHYDPATDTITPLLDEIIWNVCSLLPGAEY